MKTRTWMLIGSIAAVILIAAIVLVPMTFAQGPVNYDGFGPGRGSMMTNGVNTNYDPTANNAWTPRQGMGMRQQAFMQAPGNGSGFVDEDGDGVCDNCGTGAGQGSGFVDEDGDGVCDNFVDEDGDGVCDNAGQRRGAGFVDEDGDGVCDNCGTGQGRGAGFVDEDGDGVCDHAGTAQQSVGRGRGMGRWAQ